MPAGNVTASRATAACPAEWSELNPARSGPVVEIEVMASG